MRKGIEGRTEVIKIVGMSMVTIAPVILSRTNWGQIRATIERSKDEDVCHLDQNLGIFSY